MSSAADARLVTLEEIRAAATRVAGVVVRTPLLPFGPPLDGDRLGRPRCFLKPESLQPIGAFKLRGAYNALASLRDDQRAAGVVTHSSGNHAQGIARAARLLGIRAVIVMPSDAPAVKVAAVRADGAEIVVAGMSGSERTQRAHELAERHGLVLVPSFDDRAIVCGQGTAGIEIVEQVAELDGAARARDGGADPSEDGAARGADPVNDGAVRAADAVADPADGGDRAGAPSDGDAPGAPALTVLVPIGGGGLAAGIATAVKSLRPSAHVYGVEPTLAADARDSLREGRIVSWPPELVARTSADGMRTEALGTIPFRQLQRYLDGVITVEETEIARAVVRALRHARLVLEPSGATSLAAWLFHGQELPPTGRVVCVLSGGNVDPDRLRELTAAGEAAGA